MKSTLIVLALLLPPVSQVEPALMTAADLLSLPVKAPDRVLSYGREPSQYGELRLPAGRGPHPVVVLVHGGCFRKEYADARSIGAIADALKGEGIATWSIEYRRLSEPGSGWPGTYRDVGAGVDYLRRLAPRYGLDLRRGGHPGSFRGRASGTLGGCAPTARAGFSPACSGSREAARCRQPCRPHGHDGGHSGVRSQLRYADSAQADGRPTGSGA